jgi:hypothetical protein
MATLQRDLHNSPAKPPALPERIEAVLQQHLAAIRMLFDWLVTVGLRDRALIGVMTYAFARVGAVVAMRVEDYFANGKRWWVRLHEKRRQASRNAGPSQARSLPR